MPAKAFDTIREEIDIDAIYDIFDTLADATSSY